MSKHKSRFINPSDGKYRSHSQVHKAKNKYDRKDFDIKNEEMTKIDRILIELNNLSKEDRLVIIRSYCISCGSMDNSCQCWNDE